jgi:hypothetical protein
VHKITKLTVWLFYRSGSAFFFLLGFGGFDDGSFSLKEEWHIKLSFIGSFVCLFIAARAIFQLSGGCHLYRWQGCIFWPMLGAQGLWAGGIFIVRHGTSVYTVSFERPAPTSHSGIRTPNATDHCTRRSNHCATQATCLIGSLKHL